AVGDLEQDVGAGGRSHLAPRTGCGVRGVERLLDVLGGRACDLANDLAADRRAVLEVAAFRGRHPAASDEVLVPIADADLLADALQRRRRRVRFHDELHVWVPPTTWGPGGAHYSLGG